MPSEDPLHAAEYAAAYIVGFQGDGPFLRSGAMPKHLAAYDQEGNFGPHDRTHFCAPVSLRSLVEYHWPPFHAALVTARAAGVMCAANGYGVDGAPGAASCAHADFNNGVLRDQWGWGGAMVTDGNGVGYLYESYGHGAINCGDGATGPTSAVGYALRGGVDVELGDTYSRFALAAIVDGNATMAQVDSALSRTMPFIFRLGLMNPGDDVPWSALGPADVDTAAARTLATEAAAQAVVLLRNNNATILGALGSFPLIPLDLRLLSGRTLAVIGPNADSADSMLANYHGSNTLAANHTPLLALRRAAAAAGVTIAYAPGCATVLCEDNSGFAAAVSAATSAAAVIFIGGNAPWRGGAGHFNSSEGEEYDRDTLTLAGQQEALISAVLAAGAATAVVLMRGGPIALSDELLNDSKLTTLLDVCYPGEMGGEGLAAVLLGDTAPSGRLPTTVYPASFISSRNITDYNFTSGDGVTHMYYTGTPQWTFGYGLSTTRWNLTWLSAVDGSDGGRIAVDAPDWISGASPNVAYGVAVTNIGTRTSDLSVLGTIEGDGSPDLPRERLFDFVRTAAVAPGETRTLYFTLQPSDAARVRDDGSVVLHDTTRRVRIGLPGLQELYGELVVRRGASASPALVSRALFDPNPV